MSRRACLGCLTTFATLLLVSDIARAVPVGGTLRVIPCFGHQTIAGHDRLGPLPQLRIDAASVDAFTVKISWVAQVGAKYTVRELGGSYQYSGDVAPILRRPGDPSAPVGPPAPTPPRTQSATHESALPGTSHEYEVRETLLDGTEVCGTASATTPSPPGFSVSGQFLDPHHVTVTFKQPYLAFTTRLYRPPRPFESNLNPNNIPVASDIGRPGHYSAAVSASGGNVALTVDPGPPASSYSAAGQYNRGPLSYPLVLEAEWTENADGTGRMFVQRQPFQVQGVQPIIGYADLHSHQFSYCGFGGDPTSFPLGRHFFGRAFDKDGDISKALPACTPQHGPAGTGDLADSMMNDVANTPRWGHSVDGSSAFDGWPTWNGYTHQAYYEDWLKRAHEAGLKLIVVHPVNNEWMCTTLNHVSTADIAAFVASAGATLPVITSEIVASQTQIDESCKDKSAAINQINEAFAMQAAIDARSGGAGKGWYRIVRSPSEARSAILNGQLAVVLGMEVDNPFECTIDNPDCVSSSGELPVYVKSQLDAYYNMGVRHFFPIHFYDNAFGGSANSNFLITNNWKNRLVPRNCPEYEYDLHICNANGLTKSGKAFINALMGKGMIIDVDHMSALAFDETLSIVRSHFYPVVSGHTGFTEIAHSAKSNEGNRTPQQVSSIVQLGGMFAIIPHQGDRSEIDQYPAGSNIAHRCGNSSETVAQAYRYAVAKTGGGPVAFGTDLNGFAGWPGPRFGSDACLPAASNRAAGYDPNSMANRLAYPFTIKATGVSITLDHSVVGGKAFDFNTDGFAHIGMLPDMIADLQALGMQPAELDPLFASAEGYIRVWEQAEYMAAFIH